MKLRQQLIDFEDVIDEAESQTKVAEWIDHIGSVNTVVLDLHGSAATGSLSAKIVVGPGAARYESVRFRKLADGTPVAYHRIRIASEPFPIADETNMRDLRFLEKLEIAGLGEEAVWVSPSEAEIIEMQMQIETGKALAKDLNREINTLQEKLSKEKK